MRSIGPLGFHPVASKALVPLFVAAVEFSGVLALEQR